MANIKSKVFGQNDIIFKISLIIQKQMYLGFETNSIMIFI